MQEMRDDMHHYLHPHKLPCSKQAIHIMHCARVLEIEEEKEKEN